MDRRRFLFGGAAVVGATVVGAGLLQVQPSARVEPREPLRAFSPRQFAALAAFAEAVLPPTDGLPSAWELRVPEKVDALVDRMHPAQAADVGLLLDLVESPVVGALLGGVPRPFSQLDRLRRERVLAGWRDSRFQTRRMAWKALAGLVKGAYWADPAVDHYLGYRRLQFGP